MYLLKQCINVILKREVINPIWFDHVGGKNEWSLAGHWVLSF